MASPPPCCTQNQRHTAWTDTFWHLEPKGFWGACAGAETRVTPGNPSLTWIACPGWPEQLKISSLCWGVTGTTSGMQFLCPLRAAHRSATQQNKAIRRDARHRAPSAFLTTLCVTPSFWSASSFCCYSFTAASAGTEAPTSWKTSNRTPRIDLTPRKCWVSPDGVRNSSILAVFQRAREIKLSHELPWLHDRNGK